MFWTTSLLGHVRTIRKKAQQPRCGTVSGAVHDRVWAAEEEREQQHRLTATWSSPSRRCSDTTSQPTPSLLCWHVIGRPSSSLHPWTR
eukprot:scaffold14703_cov175-Ochromonas_danica.AAC.3